MQFLPGRVFTTSLVFALGASIASLASAIGPRIVASPHDDHHLLIVRPQELVDADWVKAQLVEEPQATFNHETAMLTKPLQTDVKVKHPGKYTVWVRITQRAGKPTPVQVDFQAGGKTLLAGKVQADSGAADQGGPEGYKAYAATAKQNTPKGAVATFETDRFDLAADEKKSGGNPAGESNKPKLADDTDLGDDLLNELREKPADPWAHLARLDEQDEKQPGYWWKLGEADLPAGRVRMNVAAAGTPLKKPVDAPRFDAVLLTTNDKLAYPFTGDINETPATFVRFRIDELPKTGLRLGVNVQTHVLQQPAASARFGKEVIDKDDLFTEPGYTCWYRLQDIKYMPAHANHEVGIRIQVNDESSIYKPAKVYDGVTQFASFPHNDFIVREFDWSEPLGLNYTCSLDVANYPHRLMTFRDHAREHYQSALTAAQRVSPLTRGELYFTTICGSMDSNDRDYLLKTIRLLGINSNCELYVDRSGERLFGWNRSYFMATMPWGDLFNEKSARETYDKYFSEIFATDQDAWKDTWSFCYMDEPGELYKESMSAPYWQYVDDPEQPYWYDPVGGSALHIKQTDLPEECVLEGIVERTSEITFRLAMDDMQEPSTYRLWMLGSAMGPAINSNLGYGKYVEGAFLQPIGYRYVRSLGSNLGQLKFKIVYQKGVATLFINDRTIDQQVDLPMKPSFGIAGGPKKIYALRLRPLRPGEGVKLENETEANPEAAELGRAVLEELELDDLPAWARPMPLKKFVEEQTIYVGGVRGLAQNFRTWLQEQGLKPEFFGKDSWDDVRPLTLADLVRDEHEARLFYWSRRYSNQLTPRNFGLISEAIHKHAPNKKMVSYAALSGGVIYRARQMPLDMMHVGSLGNTATGGISDWMFYSTWRWDSHQAVAYSAELYNTGARRHGERPVSFPMMHCVAPTTFRAFTQLGAQVKVMCLYSYGPHYLNYPDSWAQADSCYDATARLTARSAPADDILSPGIRRPCRVALLYPHSTEYWSTEDSFDDRRATFLALSHDYYQPEVVSEQQIESGALKHYDALYVVDRHVSAESQKQIGDWVAKGGLLWACADALTRDQYDQPSDLLKTLTGIERTWPELSEAKKKAKKIPSAAPIPPGPRVASANKNVAFRPHTVLAAGIPTSIKLGKNAAVLAKYEDGRPAWSEEPVGKGCVVYIGHRAGATYTSKNIIPNGHRELWADTGRELLSTPLFSQKIVRQLSISKSAIMASPISSDAGTAIVLYNMRPNSLSDLKLELREPKAPHSVTHLVNGELVPLEFTYADGVAKISLPELNEDDIVYVRPTPVAGDDRMEVMEARTKEQLQSDEIESLSAGAWMAGFYPQWKLAEQVAPLASHTDWRVRRAAAESIGKLHFDSAGDALVELTAKETDPHTLAEQLNALALLQHPKLADVCTIHLNSTQFVVRQAVLKALADVLLHENTADAKAATNEEFNEAAQAAALTGIADADQRVRRQAMRILARLEPKLAAQKLLECYALHETVAEIDRPLWAEAIAKDDGAFQALVELSPQLEMAMLMQLGQHRRDAGLAEMLVAQASQVKTADAITWSLAMKNQRDAAAAKKLLAVSKELPEHVVYYVPLVLETTFEAGLGNVLSDWEAELLH